MGKSCRGIFVTATGTDVGKTFICALLLKEMGRRKLRAGYYKAALSGAVRENDRLIAGDAEYVRRIASLETPAEHTVAYVYEHAFSPHLAARLAGRPVKMEKIKKMYAELAAEQDYLVVEGSGGIVCPIRMDEQQIMLEDIIKTLQLELLIVAPSTLGAINGAVLTAFYAQKIGLGVKGFILNNFHRGNIMEEDNKELIERLTGLPVLACVQENAVELDVETDFFQTLFATAMPL